MSEADRAGSFRATSLGYQVNHLARLFVRLLADRISPYGVVPGQFPQLIALYEHDGLTPTELSRAVDIEPGTMTKTLRRMERDGLVERRPDADDGRAVRIYLTPRARALEPELMATARSINEAVTDALSATRRRDSSATSVPSSNDPSSCSTSHEMGARHANSRRARPARYRVLVSSGRVPGGVVHKLPGDLRKALIANPTALDAWKDITPLARNEFICWVEDAKQDTTRERRIRRTEEELEEGQRRPCCWPGCKHRERTGR